MSKSFKIQKREVKELHNKYEEYLSTEFGMDCSGYLSNPDNFVEGVYYHQANSLKDRNNILKSGFRVEKVSDSHCGVGRGLYVGRDKNALVNFYSVNLSRPKDFTIKITGDFNFFDSIQDQTILKEDTKDLEEKVLDLGYDGIRYYDPDSTGEEFVLFRFSHALIQK